MNPSTTTRTGPRYWVVGITVFLTVVLAGLAVPGASALWSQQANATVSVTTGHWKNTQPGWTVPQVMAFEGVDYNGWTRRHTATLVFTPQNSSDRLVPGLSYLVTVVNNNGGTVNRVGAVTVTGEQRRVDIDITRGFIDIGRYTVSITPVVNGIQGVAATRDFRTIAGTLEWTN